MCLVWGAGTVLDTVLGGGALQPGRYVGLVYGARLRSREDRLRLEAAYREVFGPDHPLQAAEVSLHCSAGYVSVG